MKRLMLIALGMIALRCQAAQEPATPPPVAAPNKPADPRGPLIEITPLTGGVTTGYLLAMKDGVMDIEAPNGDVRQEKTSELKSVHFIAPAPPPVAALPHAAPEKDKEKTDTAAATPPARNELHRRMMELTRKSRSGKLSAEEEAELSQLREKIIPNLSMFGGGQFLKQVANTEEDARQIAAQGAGKLDAYIVEHRQMLKDAANERDMSMQVLRLVCAYREQKVHFTRLIEQITQDAEQIIREPVRTVAKRRLPFIVDIVAAYNGEKIPNPK